MSLISHKKVVKHINELDDSGMAPLHYAARFNQFDIVKLLVEKAGAGEGDHIIHLVIHNSHYFTMKSLS